MNGGDRDCALATLERIGQGRVVAILRGDFGGEDDNVTQALAGQGVTALELTVDSPDAFGRIDALALAYRGRVAVGAGTVTTTGQVAAAAAAGATFIVSPNRDRAVISAAVAAGMVAIPGCMTPSEIVEAREAGAQAVKLFPAQVLGPAFARALLAPLPGLRMVPTGGVTPGSARAWREAGAWAVGVGSELVGRGRPDAAALAAIATRAATFVGAAA